MKTLSDRLKAYSQRRDELLREFDRDGLIALLQEHKTPFSEDTDWETVMHMARSGCRSIDLAVRRADIDWLAARGIPSLADEDLGEHEADLPDDHPIAINREIAMNIIFQPDLWRESMQYVS